MKELIPGVSDSLMVRAWQLAMNLALSADGDELLFHRMEAQSIRRQVYEGRQAGTGIDIGLTRADPHQPGKPT